MELSGLSIRALQSDYQSAIGRELAQERTQNNGIDEIFFEYNNKHYVAYSADNVDIQGINKARNGATLNGIPVNVTHVDDELNSWKEQTWFTTKDVLINATPDGIGGAAAAAIAIKVGLGGNKLVKTAAIAGFVTSFFKEAISVTLTDISEYGNANWNNLKTYTDLQPPRFAESTPQAQASSLAAPAVKPDAPQQKVSATVGAPVQPQSTRSNTVQGYQTPMSGIVMPVANNGLPMAIGQNMSAFK